jgi:chorismate dehydratase
MPEIELMPGVPTDLNRWLVEGVIDLGPISSIAYARNHRRLLLSRRLSISSSGAVDSIQLVARRPLSEIRSVALTRQSATSVSLLKTILRLHYGREVNYGELSGSVAEALQEYDAVLLIGDQGLEALYSCRPPTTCYDLGALWQEWTGLPMVYAVWAAREDFAATNGPELLAVEEELVRCMGYGREHLVEVVDSALGRFDLDRPSLTRYFAVLRYDFTEEYRRGLNRFYELAREAGELEEVPELRFIDVMAVDAEDDAAGPRQTGGGEPRAANTGETVAS